MGNAAVEKEIFKPFLVESGNSRRNIFRVVSVTEGVYREQIEKLLENLPVVFQIRKDFSSSAESINEPLEVYVHGSIISIYPPRRRMAVCTTFGLSKMQVDNVMDMVCPGRGQIRTCVYFNLKILGIESWSNTERISIKVDMYVYPKSKIEEPIIEPPTFGKWDVRNLLELIAGGDKDITVEQLHKWRKLIMYAVKSMRSLYENPDVAEDYPIRLYYKPCWER